MIPLTDDQRDRAERTIRENERKIHAVAKRWENFLGYDEAYQIAQIGVMRFSVLYPEHPFSIRYASGEPLQRAAAKRYDSPTKSPYDYRLYFFGGPEDGTQEEFLDELGRGTVSTGAPPAPDREEKLFLFRALRLLTFAQRRAIVKAYWGLPYGDGITPQAYGRQKKIGMQKLRNLVTSGYLDRIKLLPWGDVGLRLENGVWVRASDYDIPLRVVHLRLCKGQSPEQVLRRQRS